MITCTARRSNSVLGSNCRSKLLIVFTLEVQKVISGQSYVSPTEHQELLDQLGNEPMLRRQTPHRVLATCSNGLPVRPPLQDFRQPSDPNRGADLRFARARVH